MDQLVTQVSLVGIATVMILREVFQFLSKREPSLHMLMKEIRSDTRILVKWHEPVNGEQSWKNPRMQDVLESLDKSVEQHGRILDKICDVLERMQKSGE